MSCSAGTRTVAPRPAGACALAGAALALSEPVARELAVRALAGGALTGGILSGGLLIGGALTGCAVVGRRLGGVAGWVDAGSYRGNWSVIGPSETVAPVSGARRATTGGVTGGVTGGRCPGPVGGPTAGAQLRPVRVLRFGCVADRSGLCSRADGRVADSR